jgi:hypothetical protein
MRKYTATQAIEFGIGQGPNGSGCRRKIKGAYTVSPEGRKVRAFTDQEGGLAAAEKWAEVLNDRLLS